MLTPGQTITKQFIVTDPATGGKVDADSTPVVKLVREGTDTAETVDVSSPSQGVYVAVVTIPATWTPGDDIELRADYAVSTVSISQMVYSDILVGVVYHAEIDFLHDDVAGDDLYSVIWFQNGQPYTDAIITTLNVYDMEDGSPLVNDVTMDAALPNGSRHKKTDVTIQVGKSYLVQVSADFQEGSVIWQTIISRDVS